MKKHKLNYESFLQNIFKISDIRSEYLRSDLNFLKRSFLTLIFVIMKLNGNLVNTYSVF